MESTKLGFCCVASEGLWIRSDFQPVMTKLCVLTGLAAQKSALLSEPTAGNTFFPKRTRSFRASRPFGLPQGRGTRATH